MSGTIADLIGYYPQAWRDPKYRPDAAMCTVQYDFVDWYKGRINALSGFTKTKNDQGIVGAFRISRCSPGNLVQVHWKPTARLNTPWLGVNGGAKEPGFVVLRNSTNQGPLSVSSRFLRQEARKLAQLKRDLTSHSMQEVLEAENFEGALPWLLQCVETGELPILREVEMSTPDGQLGRVVEIGVPENPVQVQLLDAAPPATDALFFRLPEAVIERMNNHRAIDNGEGIPVHPLPNVRLSSKNKRKEPAAPKAKPKKKKSRKKRPKKPAEAAAAAYKAKPKKKKSRKKRPKKPAEAEAEARQQADIEDFLPSEEEADIEDVMQADAEARQ